MKRIVSFSPKLKETLSKWKNTLYYNFPVGAKVYLIGTPVHCNVGDSAIVLASLKFLRECYPKAGCVKEMTWSHYRKYGYAIHRLWSTRSRVLGHGGGNMGDVWLSEEKTRQKLLTDSMNCSPVILPQTLYYSDTKTGKSEQEKSTAFYNDPRITVVAREKISYDKMIRLYPKANVWLTPDIVLSTTAADYGVSSQKRNGILWCMRSDVEKYLTPDFEEALWHSVEACHKTIRKTDMNVDHGIDKGNRRETVRKKMQEFADSELVITDRLHGMIFAAITETPCLVFSNNQHKIQGTYEWIRHLPYIRFAETLSDAKKNISELLTMKDCHFDNAPLLPYFDALKQELRKENQSWI